ncbi:MAG TPA: hypothetical protein VFV94_06120 [Polyangiaceae bacterium]|nr:hypothetical protein [Polyangiaceae bacterium]
MRRFFEVLLVGSFIGLVPACGGSTPQAASAESPSMTPAEAREFIAEVQKERGVTPDETPVTSVEQLLDILTADDINRFDAANRLVAGKPGIDAMSLNATLELCWSDSFNTVALIVEELRKRDAVEVQRLTQERDAGRDFTDQDKKELERAEQAVAFDVKARAALEVLAKDHLAAGGALVHEELRQFPSDPRTYRVAAFYYLLTADWQHFDTSMQWLKDTEATDSGLQYLRGLEALLRYAIKKEASDFLRKSLELNAKQVRAQAKLVLTEEGIEAIHAELEKLRAVAPRHPVVTIAGPSITTAYQMATAFSQARATRPAAAAPPASTGSAPAQDPAPAPATPAAPPAPPAAPK